MAVLPYLEETTLYQKFHRDEPWNSPNNKPLIEQMPQSLWSSHKPPAVAGHTRFVVPVGKNTCFDDDKGVTISQITDGTSKTILALEVGEDKSVIWTKPDDLDFDPQKPLAGLGNVDKGFDAVFCDCHVMRTLPTIKPDLFRRMIIRNDGETVDFSQVPKP